jgi:pilus assembly protein Flp/PilA
MLKSFIVDESGASLVEYGLLVGLIAVVAITAVSALGTKVKNVFATVNNTLNSYNL